jgi:transcriptional regulator with XRE-family HTH domain
MTIIDELRAAIRAVGLSQNELAKHCKIEQAVLSRFLADKRTLTLETAAKICTFLNLHLKL